MKFFFGLFSESKQYKMDAAGGEPTKIVANIITFEM